MTASMPIVDILFRGLFVPGAVALGQLPPIDVDDDGLVRSELREASGAVDGSTLTGVYTRFDAWYEIDSWLEGNFLERVVKGSGKKTMRENRSTIVCSYDHGFDPELGDKPLGPIEDLRETDEGAFYAVPLLDTSYNREFIQPALQGRTIDGRSLGSTLGASFRFRILRDEWNMAPKVSDYNPKGIPERPIREYRLFEFGPVPYPASPAASAGVRGLTDWYMDRHRQRAGGTRPESPAGLATGDEGNATPPADGHLVDPSRSAVAYLAMAAKARRSHP